MDNKGVLAVITAVILSFGTAFVYFTHFHTPNAEVMHYNYSLGEDFITNLKDGDTYIKATIELETDDKNTVKFLDEKKPQIRDCIIEILRNTSIQDIEGSEGQINLKNKIKNKVNNILGSNKITNVFFDNLVTQ